MNGFSGLYLIRDMLPEDRNFILATFLRGLYYGDSWFSVIPKPVFMDNYSKIASALVDNPKNMIKVACLKEDQSVILGYSILSPNFNKIAWVHVKKAWRKQGIGRSLLPQYPTSCLHLSAVGKSLMTKYPDMIFNPFNFN